MSRAPGGGLQLIRQDDFTGGLNLRANAFQLAANESPDLLNVDIDPRGGFSSRAGSEQLTNDPLGEAAHFGSDFTPTDAVRLFAWNMKYPQLVLMTTTQILYSDGAYGTNFSEAHVATGVVPHGFQCAQWETLDGSLLYAVGTAEQSVWMDSTFAVTALTESGAAQWQDDLAAPTGLHMPIATHIASHIDRMWVADTVEDSVEYRQRLRFSHPLFPQSWRELDYIDIPDGGGYITGIVSFGGNLVVFKDHGVFILSGYSADTFQLIPISLRHGCVNPLAFTVLDGNLYFFDGESGLFSFDGVNLRNLSEPIATAFSDEASFNYSGGDDWTWERWNGIRVWLGGRNIWLSDVNGGATYVFDPTLGRGGAWTRYVLANNLAFGHGCEFNGEVMFINPLADYSDPLISDRPAVMFRDPNRADDYWDGENHGFESHYTTRWHDAGTVSAKKRWRRLDLVCKQPSSSFGTYSLDLKVYYDWQEGVVRRSGQSSVLAMASDTPFIWGTTDWEEGNWGAAIEGAQHVRSAALGPARSVQVKLSAETQALKPWGVDSITYKFNYRRVR